MAHEALERVTLGTSILGSPSADEQATADALADAFVASEFRQIDTSNIYAGGLSEATLGRALRRAGHADPVIFTKVDRDPETGRFDGDSVLRSVEESLTRLGLDRVPLLHLHDPYTITMDEAFAPDGAVPALVRIKEEGIADKIGIAAGTTRLVEDYVKTDAFDAVLTHNRWTLADRGGAGILDAAAERGMTVFNAAPFGGGILAGSARAGERYGYRPASEGFLEFVSRLRGLADEFGIPLAAAALQFSIRDPRIHSTVVGASSLDRLSELRRLLAVDVTDEFFSAVAELGPPPESPND